MSPLLAYLQRWLRPFRRITVHELRRVPAIATLRERLMLAGGLAAVMGGLALAVGAWYVDATEPQPAVGGTYVEGIIGSPRLVNPIFAPANDVDQDLAALLYAGLFRVDERGAVVPDLAERADAAPDGKSLTITLRSDLRWHDGALVTADDVVFTIRLIDDPGVGSPLRPSFRGVRVERINDRAVRFTIDRPLAVFQSALTVGLLPEHLWADIPPAHLALAELNLRPIGAGPYRFVGLTKDRRGGIRSYTVERYAGSHRTPAHLERITFRFADDVSAVVAALNSREVDGIGTFAPSIASAITRSDVTRHPLRLPQTTAVFLNQRRNAALRDVRVRRALDRTVDRHAIATDVLGGEPIGGPIIPSFSPEADPPPPEPLDRDAAARLLDEAGWTRRTVDELVVSRTREELRKLGEEKRKAAPRGKRGTVEPPTDDERRAIEERVREELRDCAGCVPLPYHRLREGNPLAITLTTADLPELVATAERVRDAWRAVGVRATIEAVPIDRLRNEAILHRAYDALLFSQILGPDPDPFPFWHSSQVRHPGLNLAVASNKTVDKLLEQARATTDHAARRRLYADFQRRLAEERPAIFLTAPSFTYPMSRNVRGVRVGQPTQPSDRFATVTEWYTETTRRWKR